MNAIIQGPRYDEKGDIIKRSIVGTVDQLKREGKVSLDNRITDEDSSMLRSFVINHQCNKKQIVNNNKRELTQLNKISKEDIRLHIDQVQNNIKLSEISLRSKEDSLPIIERNLITRQRRNLESSQKQQDQCNQLQLQLANRCQRFHNNTLISQSQGYREKKQLLDTLNTLEKESNVKEWYQKLRNHHLTNQPTIEIIKNPTNVTIVSDKFKNMINQRLNQKYYNADYLIANGNSKLKLESKEARDLMILPQELSQLQQQDFNYSNYNKKDISHRSSYRIVQLQ
ncbi:unnamed protein product [Paramecium sonneborni]|uniref:Uncharacterized protein n=1 Tax=Paramecium sonneborni TaxID=65129 RepID=A0A8S1R1M2_9CILI|nr:unnamed protein product [Paramecium sonneborni]